MSRALLGDYQDRVLWRPAFLKLLDHLDSLPSTQARGEWTQELLDTEPESIAPKLRGIAAKTYHASSKGIHHEFVLSAAAYYDNVTLQQLSDDALKLVATMALICNFGEATLYSLPPNGAVRRFEQVTR